MELHSSFWAASVFFFCIYLPVVVVLLSKDILCCFRSAVHQFYIASTSGEWEQTFGEVHHESPFGHRCPFCHSNQIAVLRFERLSPSLLSLMEIYLLRNTLKMWFCLHLMSSACLDQVHLSTVSSRCAAVSLGGILVSTSVIIFVCHDATWQIASQSNGVHAATDDSFYYAQKIFISGLFFCSSLKTPVWKKGDTFGS